MRRESELEIAALADGQDMEGAVDTRGVPPAEMPRAYAAAVAAENLQSMAGTSRGPRVDVQWPPSTALMSLQLASCLKPGAALADALAFAGAFSLASKLKNCHRSCILGICAFRPSTSLDTHACALTSAT